MEKLPVYNIKVNEDLNSKEGIDYVSLVDYPAIESNWVAFKKETQKYFFDQERQMLYGAILIPGKPIYRNDPDMGEYNVVFPEAEVIKLVRKLQAQKKTVNLNYQHKENSQLKDAVIQEIWLTGKNDKSKDFGFDFPINTAMVGVFIGDKSFWAKEVKTGNVKGFSIEGWLDMEIKNQIQKNMNEEKQFVTAKTTDGVEVTAESFEVGSEVFTTNEAGEQIALADGEYMLENNTSIVVLEGKISEVKEEAPAEEALDSETTEVIQKAVAPVIAEMAKQFEEKLAALEVKFSNQPGAPKKADPKPVQLSGVDKVKQFLNKNKTK